MDSKKIGAFIALNRKKKGLTQEQLGEKLGVRDQDRKKKAVGTTAEIAISMAGLKAREGRGRNLSFNSNNKHF